MLAPSVRDAVTCTTKSHSLPILLSPHITSGWLRLLTQHALATFQFRLLPPPPPPPTARFLILLCKKHRPAGMCARERQNTKRLMTARWPLRRIYKTAAAFVESIFYCSANDTTRCPIVLLGCKDKILYRTGLSTRLHYFNHPMHKWAHSHTNKIFSERSH